MIVVGLDPSLRNWGIAIGEVKGSTLIKDIYTCRPVLPTGKQTRQNSLDTESAHQLFSFTTSVIPDDVAAVFVETPVGSQSARSMASYGICVGVIGSLRASGIPIFEVTATEVKLALTGLKTATKEQMINTAYKLHPEAPWPTHKVMGVPTVTASKAEHMADAIGAIYAGMKLPSFKAVLAISQRIIKDKDVSSIQST